MDKYGAHDQDSDNLASTSIQIPQGLLRNVNSGLYAQSRRDTGHHDEEGQTIGQLIEQPAQAVLATYPLQRSRTPDFGPGGHVQLGLGRRDTAVAPTRLPLQRPNYVLHEPPPTYQQQAVEPRHIERARSIEIASFYRQRQLQSHSDGPPSSVNRYRQAGQAPRLSSAHRETTLSRADSSLARDFGTNPFHQFFQPRSASPVPLVEEPDSYEPDELVEGRVRHPSFVPGTDTIFVRHPTGDAPTAASIIRKASVAVGNAVSKVLPRERQSSIAKTYERAKLRQQKLQRSKPAQLTFTYCLYLMYACIAYFIFIGRPLWGGTVWYIYVLYNNFLGSFVGGSAIFIGLAFFYAFGPLLVFFEPPAPMPTTTPESGDLEKTLKKYPSASFIRPFEQKQPVEDPPLDPANETALLIPCYKSASLLPATLEAALKIFPATSIFVCNNSNFPTPPDNTEEVCTSYGVNHVYIPVGSKIVAQYVGSYVARSFPYALLIDDDCLLPPNFPIVTDRLKQSKGKIRCLGYTLTSVGPNRSRGNWCQQAQDLEYKLSGLQRLFAGRIGSATFPHGAMVLWETEFLLRTFKEHPGFSVSEDWFFGHVARELGSRITMCSSIFVETETPNALFFPDRGGARGGFGEMTVFKQRFKRWNFFFVNGCWYNMLYILFSWKLGWWEIGAKIFVFQEIYETLLYLITPIILPISFIVRPEYTAYLFAATFGLYLVSAIIFNEVHLRLASRGFIKPENAGRDKENEASEIGKQAKHKWWQQRPPMVDRSMLLFYYMAVFKPALTVVNVLSCWWSLWQYAKYFAKRHPKIIEDERAVGVVLKIEEDQENGVFEEDKDTLQRTGTQKTVRRSTLRSETGHLRRAQSGRSTKSGSTTYSSELGSRRGRRMTVTAIKVDVVDFGAIGGPLRRKGPADEDIAPDEIVFHPLEGTETLARTRSWASSEIAPDEIVPWHSHRGNEDRKSIDRTTSHLEPVVEVQDEEVEYMFPHGQGFLEEVSSSREDVQTTTMGMVSIN